MHKKKLVLPSVFNPLASIASLHIMTLCGLLLFIASCSHSMMQTEPPTDPSTSEQNTVDSVTTKLIPLAQTPSFT